MKRIFTSLLIILFCFSNSAYSQRKNNPKPKKIKVVDNQIAIQLIEDYATVSGSNGRTNTVTRNFI
jgi:hypothetical protein